MHELVTTYGDPEQAAQFDAVQWLDEWLNRPQPSLNMAKPADLMLTEEGLAQVETLLKRMAVGAFA
ncbi:antitoxin Xre/MbcA/ParS toxin-binding domain-containing protein [Comamonas odontotermitis]|uniref:antitoxin Xre/MbcA/ParS toxin-binding domain-containing protein n=1 Tax=Comamonas odontotermitis TaxID=379895 RepID=UPI001610CF66|nr:MbcA/ParS/Xre antitoxin family protein [Comamonas odontotermitis]